MNHIQQIAFPCRALPSDAAEARLLGVYPQRQEGLFMQRIKTPAGRLTTAQLRGLAAMAARYTPGYPLHFTTRQDVEFHGASPSDLPAIQAAAVDLGLTGAASCGDSVRNVLVCPENGFEIGGWDATGVVDALRRCAEEFPLILDLPRKFKIAVSSCPRGCARPFINDFGLFVNDDGTFRAIVAGSLGSKPAAGLVYSESLDAADVLPLLRAALRLFHAEGDRKVRMRARLRHVRERLGDDVFLKRLRELAEEEKRTNLAPPPELRRVERGAAERIRLPLPLGDLTADEATRLADATEAAGAEIRLGFEHDLFLFGNKPVALDDTMRRWIGRPRVVACPGATWCSKGIADVRATATRILDEIDGHADVTIALTGCPNNCSQAAVADIGLVGRMKRVGDERVEHYRLSAGGGKGATGDLAVELHEAVHAEQSPKAVAWLARELLKAAANGQSLPQYVRAERARLSESLPS